MNASFGASPSPAPTPAPAAATALVAPAAAKSFPWVDVTDYSAAAPRAEAQTQAMVAGRKGDYQDEDVQEPYD